MRRIILIAALILCAFTVGTAQEKPSAPAKPEIKRLDPQPSNELAEAQRQAVEARTALEAANANYQAAQLRVKVVLLQAMAEMKLSPKEWAIKQDQQGGIYFEKLPSPAAASVRPDTSPAGSSGAPPSHPNSP